MKAFPSALMLYNVLNVFLISLFLQKFTIKKKRCYFYRKKIFNNPTCKAFSYTCLFVACNILYLQPIKNQCSYKISSYKNTVKWHTCENRQGMGYTTIDTLKISAILTVLYLILFLGEVLKPEISRALFKFWCEKRDGEFLAKYGNPLLY